jgi:hypothetical protein
MNRRRLGPEEASEQLGISSSWIPMPVSLTSTMACVASARARSSTRPPSGVNLIAFETRLS